MRCIINSTITMRYIISGSKNPHDKSRQNEKACKGNNEETANHHTVQIFAEMQGQVCHPEFYEGMNNEYQDVSSQSLSLTRQYSFVIHIRHAKFTYFMQSLRINISSVFQNLAQNRLKNFLWIKFSHVNLDRI